ncbi:hypothetical protein C6P44_002246 [Monosporozyma unispora]|nr:hypothetical protein C6P44_002246 [Kazachstania unispora]
MSEEKTKIEPVEDEFGNVNAQEEVDEVIAPASGSKEGSVDVVEKGETSEDDDEDFGNFSDASFEDDTVQDEPETRTEEEQESKEDQINQCLETLFGPIPGESSVEDDVNASLEDLIKDERPHVIYEQLFSGRLHTAPFIWKHSHIRSTMLQVLGIEDDTEAKNKLEQQLTNERETPLDDSLYIKLCQVIEADNDNNNGNTMLLRDNFRYEYTPRFHQPGSLQEKLDKEEERRIPVLLNWNSQVNDTITTEQLQQYHDELCNLIDSQAIKLKSLNRIQDGLTHDKVTFENVVTNLSGHTQRLQRDEIALYNKKMGRKVTGPTRHRDSNQWKRFSWVGL